MDDGLIDPVDVDNTWSTYPYLTADWTVCGFGIILRRDGQPLYHSDLNWYQSIPSLNAYAFSGQYLASLENLRSFPKIKWEMPALVPLVDVWHYVLGETVKTFRNATPILSTDQVLEAISGASNSLVRLLTDNILEVAPFSVRAAARLRKLSRKDLSANFFTRGTVYTVRSHDSAG